MAILGTLNQLRAKILYEWNNLPQNYVHHYVTSMRPTLSCRSELNSVWNIPATKFTWTWTPLQDLIKNIVIFTLFCDIFDQVWSLLKY